MYAIGCVANCVRCSEAWSDCDIDGCRAGYSYYPATKQCYGKLDFYFYGK